MLGGLPSFDEVSGIISIDSFIRYEHKHAWGIIEKLAKTNTAIDILTVDNHCDTEIISLMYLGSMVKSIPSAKNIKLYARFVADNEFSQKIGKTLTEIQAKLTGNLDRSEKMQLISDFADQVCDTSVETHPRHVSHYAREFVEDLEKRFDAKGELIGLSTGFNEIDRMLCGLQGGQLIVLAARPGMGKTTLALNIAENNALNNKTALICSMEMSGRELTAKHVASIGAIEGRNLKTGLVTDDEWPKVSNAIGELQNSKLIIDDQAALTISELKSKARMVKRKNGLDLIIVDYIQLMNGKGGNRTEEISYITRNLKLIAKELDVPIIALSQLNRSLESRSNKRPGLSDLRESGAIEQDADVIMFIYRDEYYNADSQHKDFAEIIFGKQRNGDTGTIFLSTELNKSRFKNAEFVPNKIEKESDTDKPFC